MWRISINLFRFFTCLLDRGLIRWWVLSFLFGVFTQLLSPLYPLIFLLLGIQTDFCFPIPTLFACCGYLHCFLLPYTHAFLLLWVFALLSASLYPHFSFVVGICLIFVAAIPNHVLFFGYIAYFPLCYTQSSIFSWV